MSGPRFIILFSDLTSVSKGMHGDRRAGEGQDFLLKAVSFGRVCTFPSLT